MAKTELFTVTDDLVVPEAGVNTVTVADFDTPVTIVIESNRLDNSLFLVRQNFSDTDWETVTDNIGGTGNVILNEKRKDVTINVPGVYGLSGRVVGTVLAYSITV